MKYFSVFLIVVIFAATCFAAADDATSGVEKKTEKRGIYGGFGYGLNNYYGGFGSHYGGGIGGHYGGGFGYPYYGGAYYGGHGAYYPQHIGHYPYHGFGFH